MLQQILPFLPFNKKLYLWLWRDYSRNQKLSLSAALIYQALENKPYDMDLRWWLNLTLLKQGHWPEALSNLEFMIANWPGDQKKPPDGWLAQLYALAARCYLYLENFSNVEKHLSIAQNMAPWDLDACATAVDLCYCTNRFEDVPSVLDRYIEMYPQVYSAYVWKARHIHYKCYDPQSAIEWYEQANLRVNPEIVEYGDRYFSAQGMLWVFIANYVEALVQCKKKEQAWELIKSYRRNHQIRSIFLDEIVISFYVESGNYVAAEQIITSLIAKDKAMPVYWALLAKIQAKQNKLEDANSSIEHSLSLSTEFFDIYETLAEIQMLQSKWDAAIETYQKLIAFLPFESDWLENCGRCYKNSGNLEKARELYEKVTMLDSLDAVAWADLGEIYFELGQDKQAFTACEKSLGFDRLSSDKREQTEKILAKTNK